MQSAVNDTLIETKMLNAEFLKEILNQNINIIDKDIINYNKQYNNLKVYYDETFHDRYFILDNKDIYLSGASVNRIGYKTSTIVLLNDKDMCNLLIDKVNKIIENKN